MEPKNILLAVTGGIAVFKAAALCSQLSQRGFQVRVMMSRSAAKFVTPLTFQTLSRHHVYLDTFDEPDPAVISHIDLADHADLVLIVPATANIIAKLAHGIADDMISTTLLAATAPVMIAPAMNVHMYRHPQVQENMRRLQANGIRFIEPGEGQLACGYVGKGRLAEPEEIISAVHSFFSSQQDLLGRKILVTAGATQEPVDPVRYFTNRSTGKMGFAIAAAARDRGADVTLVAGPNHLDHLFGVNVVAVRTAEEMCEEVLARASEMDVIIKAAAVADYRPAQVSPQKIKKTDGPLVIEMERTTDILAELGRRKQDGQILIGFAAETQAVESFAMEKLKKKNVDYIVANDVTKPGAGFAVETNIVQIYGNNGLLRSLPEMSKKEVANHILDLLVNGGQT
jgi:phosphopantothenoylcysteine decarboxylase/phosphopantothenate--cysteine ligase